MSLLHRSSSTESFTRRASTSSQAGQGERVETQYFDAQEANGGGETQGRRLSFSPLGSGEPATEPLSALEVSRSRRIAQVAVAVVYCLFAAGIVFGYAALKPVLIAEGVYRERCGPSEESSRDEEYRMLAYERHTLDSLNFMFTCAAVSTNVAALPIGTILDRYGPRVATLLGTFFLALGALFLAFASSLPFDGYLPGYLFLALGGPFVFISSFQLSNTFPRYSGLILAMLTGAFDSSSALFLLYRLIYTGTDGGFKPRHFFLVYLVVPVLILIAQVTIMPATSYQTAGELLETSSTENANGQDNTPTTVSLANTGTSHQRSSSGSDSETSGLLTKKDGSDHKKDVLAQASHEESTARASGVWGALHGLSAWQQIRTPWFILITIFTIIQMTRINFFVATVRPQYAFLLGSQQLARQVNEVFDVTLPAGGVVAIPFIGAVLDNTRTVTVLAVLVSVATLIGVLGLIGDAAWVAYLHVVIFGLFRPFYYTAVSDYTAKVFGFATFGKVYGLIICLAGLGNFSQSGLDALTWNVFDGDYRPVNAALLTAGAVVGACLVAYVGVKGRRD